MLGYLNMYLHEWKLHPKHSSIGNQIKLISMNLHPHKVLMLTLLNDATNV